MEEDDIRDLENEIIRRERENQESRARQDQAEQEAREEQRRRTERNERQSAVGRLSNLLHNLHATAHRLTHLQFKQRFKNARMRLMQIKNSTLANYDIGQLVLRLSPLLLYPAAYGMNCLFLAFISRFYALELVLGTALLKPYQSIIIVLCIFLLPLFLLWADISLQSQWVAAQNGAAKGLWFSLAAFVCLIIPAIYIYTAWLNRDVNAGETEASVNNVMFMIKGVVGLVVNILILLGGRLLHEGKSLLIFLIRLLGLRLAVNWLGFRIRRAQTRLVDTFNEFSRALSAFNSPLATAEQFHTAIDLPTRRALRAQFGYDVIDERNGGESTTETEESPLVSGTTNIREAQPHRQRQTETSAGAENSGAAVSNQNTGQQNQQTGSTDEAVNQAENNGRGDSGVVFDGNGEDEVRP